MAERGDPQVLKYVVAFLRTRTGMSQGEFGKACRVHQSQISKYETGEQPVPEESLRRMAEAADVHGSVVVLLQRFYAALLAAIDRRIDLSGVEPMSAQVMEAAALAVTPYLIEDAIAEAAGPSPEEARREAEETWTALEKYPIPERRQLIELAGPSAWSSLLAYRIGEASVQAAAGDAKEARELAELALWTAEQKWRELIDRGLPYHAAVAALDLAVLWLAAGRTDETRKLALAMDPILDAQGLGAKAREPLRLFCDAARQRSATVELARRVREQLQQA